MASAESRDWKRGLLYAAFGVGIGVGAFVIYTQLQVAFGGENSTTRRPVNLKQYNTRKQLRKKAMRKRQRSASDSLSESSGDTTDSSDSEGDFSHGSCSRIVSKHRANRMFLKSLEVRPCYDEHWPAVWKFMSSSFDEKNYNFTSLTILRARAKLSRSWLMYNGDELVAMIHTHEAVVKKNGTGPSSELEAVEPQSQSQWEIPRDQIRSDLSMGNLASWSAPEMKDRGSQKKENVLSGLVIGPVVVAEKYQRQRVGSYLIQTVIEDSYQYSFIVALGCPEVFSRFGFKSATAYGFSRKNARDDDDKNFLIKLVSKSGVIQFMSGCDKESPLIIESPVL